jgi:DNA-binding sugar fermentation-stimulating protein
MRMKDQVAVHEDQVVAACPACGEVANASDAKSKVLLPDVDQRDRKVLGHVLDQIRCRRTGAIVCNDHLSRQLVHPADALEAELERSRRLIRGDDQ